MYFAPRSPQKTQYEFFSKIKQFVTIGAAIQEKNNIKLRIKYLHKF